MIYVSLERFNSHFVVSFWKFSKILQYFSEFERNTMDWFIKTALYVPGGTFWADFYGKFRSWRSQTCRIMRRSTHWWIDKELNVDSLLISSNKKFQRGSEFVQMIFFSVIQRNCGCFDCEKKVENFNCASTFCVRAVNTSFMFCFQIECRIFWIVYFISRGY